jgi:class 3 adenylate cyclase
MSSVHSEDPESISTTTNRHDVDGMRDGSSRNDERDMERKTLARKENKAVFWSRIVVFVVLLTTAALVITFVYKITSRAQQNSFEISFESDSLKVLDSFYQSIERMMDASDALSISYTSYALSSGLTFPNVTLPDYQLRTVNTRIMSEAVVFNYHPLVTDETRKGWEAYAIDNRAQFNVSAATEFGWIQYQDKLFNQSDRRNLVEQQGYQDKIGNLAMDGLVHPAPEGTGPYLPIWQLSPATLIPVLLNFNLLSHPAAPAYIETLKSGQAVVLSAENLLGENLGGSGAYFQVVLSMSQFRYAIEDYLGDPTSPFSYPVFDSFDPETRNIAGIIGSTFYWKLYLQNILPDNRKGIICVIENSFNQTFTYRIDGSKAIYMGIGDLHDAKYDYLEVAGDMASHLSSRASPKTRSYTVVPLNTAFNSYTLRIYPSQDTEDAQVNDTPIILAVIILFVFLFTSSVFLMYDRFVARRQRVVMDRAVASSAIVSSLFPSQVRNQIYEENEMEIKKMNRTASTLDFDDIIADTDEIGDVSAPSSRPNAVLFQDTTIMFADMAGFTAWGSTRGPVEVFELLEAVYQAFDTIAARRRVFKVETIGDCYVAVAGLPKPQPDHALIMTKFAEDCIVKIRQITAKLAVTMGADTANLMIRVGLHSGSVTGGVLRGQKARFQLFGDTMNTASRMECNGQVGQIHVSEETANALMAKGKSHWLTPRADKIVAKGKGELQTYWVSTRSNHSSGHSSAGSNAVEEDAMIMMIDPAKAIHTKLPMDEEKKELSEKHDDEANTGICFEI